MGLSIIETVSRSRRICEPFSDAVDAAFVDFIANPSGINPQSEQENSDLIDEIIKNTDIISDQENNNKEGEHTHENVGVGISSFAIRKMIRSLNETQKEVFDFVSKWTREYIKITNSNVNESMKTIHIFVTGSAGFGKSQLLTTIRYFHCTKNEDFHQGLLQ